MQKVRTHVKWEYFLCFSLHSQIAFLYPFHTDFSLFLATFSFCEVHSQLLPDSVLDLQTAPFSIKIV